MRATNLPLPVRLGLIFFSWLFITLHTPSPEPLWLEYSTGYRNGPASPVLAKAFSTVTDLGEIRSAVFEVLPERTKQFVADIANPRIQSFRILAVHSVKLSPSGFQWPVAGSISSGFGMRRHPITRRSSFHEGIDIRACRGTPVNTPCDGVVVGAGRGRGIGNVVKIRTSSGLILYFGHLSAFRCRKNQVVKRGQLLGLVGATGRATGPHLHFAVKRGKKFLNPMSFLRSRSIP